MNSTARNISVGMFVLAALTALGWMIVKFGGSPRALADTYSVHMTFPTVGAVNEGADVRLNGIVVGNVSRIDLGPYMAALTAGEVYQLKVFHQGGALGGETELVRISPERLVEWNQLEAAALEDSSQLGPDPLVELADYFATQANVERAIRLAEKAVEMTRKQGQLDPAYSSLYEELLILYDRADETQKNRELKASMKACGLP